jgi:hypothetical protein
MLAIYGSTFADQGWCFKILPLSEVAKSVNQGKPDLATYKRNIGNSNMKCSTAPKRCFDFPPF